MLPFMPDVIKWIIFSDEERAVLIEAFNTAFPVPEIARVPFVAGEYEDKLAELQRLLGSTNISSLLSIRSILVSSLREGPNAVIGMTDIDCATLSAFVMLGVAGYYDYLMSIEDMMTSLGVEFFPIDDDRQKARFRIINKLNTRAPARQV